MSEVQAEQTEVKRVVTLEDGSTADFGKRANVLTVVSADSSKVTFKLFNGKVINWTVPFMSGLSEFVQSVYVFGLVSKIKSTLGNVGLEDLETAITKATAQLDAGTFTTRSASEGSLSIEQKAYATVKSTVGGRHYDEALAHWANLTDSNVIAEIIATWETFDRSKKNAIRKDPYFKLEKSQLEQPTDVAKVADI